jgi:hypothetical protein
MEPVLGRGVVHTGFWRGNLREKDLLGDILSWIFRKWDGGAWTGLSSLRIGTVGGHL